MIDDLHLRNFGPIAEIRWSSLGKINLVLGGNGAGKTFLLKSIYSSLRCLEKYRRGDNAQSLSDILFEKLYWTYQVEKLGDLVRKGGAEPLSFSLGSGQNNFAYSFGKDTNKQVHSVECTIQPRNSNSIFLPAKEVLSLHHIILNSRERDQVFGFDDTYYDLIKALQIPPTKGKNFPEFSQSRRKLEEVLGGKVDYDPASLRWIFTKNRQKFPITVAAEGVRKISILDVLLGNRFLDTQSVVIFDEPESALHPSAIVTLLDIIASLAERGVQFFLASHSYFVVKKLYLIAQQREWSIPVLSEASETGWKYHDLLDGMPENDIINQSIDLYREEMQAMP